MGTIANSPEKLLLTPAQTQELDVRLEDYLRNPDEG